MWLDKIEIKVMSKMVRERGREIQRKTYMSDMMTMGYNDALYI